MGNAIMEIQLPLHIERSILAAFNAGDYERVANQLADSGRTTNPTIKGSGIKTMPIDHLTTVPLFDASQKPAVDIWPEEEDIEDFLNFVRTHRTEDATAMGQ
jgi:hypothetical protein